jgi:transcriptional regulator with XRE-family HTH domain
MATSDDFPERVAGLLAQHRLAQGLTLEQLADKAGLHRTSLGLIERGRRRLTLDSAKRLADALGVRLSEILRTAEDR